MQFKIANFCDNIIWEFYKFSDATIRNYGFKKFSNYGAETAKLACKYLTEK